MKKIKNFYKVLISVFSTTLFISITTTLISSCSVNKNNNYKKDENSNFDSESLIKDDGDKNAIGSNYFISAENEDSFDINSNVDDNLMQERTEKPNSSFIVKDDEKKLDNNIFIDSDFETNKGEKLKHETINNQSNVKDVIIDEYKYNNLPNLNRNSWYLEDSNLPNLEELKSLENDYSIYQLDDNLLPKWIERNISILPYSYNHNQPNLPITIDDSTLSDDELIQMFDYIANNVVNFDMFSKNLKIDAKRLSKLYIKWTIERWKLYPFFSFENGNMRFMVQNSKNNINLKTWFTEEELNDDWYLYSISTPDFLDKLYKNGKYKIAFLNFIKNGLSLISDEMSTRDKVWAIFNYILDYFKYDPIIYEQDESIYRHEAVCANYASAYSFLLNLIGIPSLPMLTGFQNSEYRSLHAVSWVYLDLYNNGNSKWYLSDPTFSDEKLGSKDVLEGKYYAFTSSSYAINNFLLPVGENKFNSNNGTQFPFGQYWGLPLPNEILDNAHYSNKSIGNTIFNSYIMEKYNYRFQQKFKISKYIYVNGKYYLLRKNVFRNTVDFVFGDFFDDIQTLKRVEISASPFSGIPNDIYYQILKISRDNYPLLWKRNNHVFFILNNIENQNKKLFIYNLEDKKYKIYNFNDFFPNNNEFFEKCITNFYIIDQSIVFEMNNSVWKINLFDYIDNLNFKKEFDDLYQLSLLKLNSYKIGNKYWEIHELYKKWFYKKLKSIKEDDIDNNAVSKIKLIEEWNNLLDYYFSLKDLNSFVIKRNNDVVQINDTYAKQYNFKLSTILYFAKDIYDIYNFEDEYIVELKYINDNEFITFPLKNNLYYESELNYKELLELQDKDLKLIIRNFNNQDLTFETEEFKIKLIKDDDQLNLPIIEKLYINNNISNYTNLVNIPLVSSDVDVSKEIELKLNISNIYSKHYDHKLKFYYKDFNKNVKLLTTLTLNENDEYIRFNVGKNVKEHQGVYWVVIESKNKNNNKISRIFSNSVYVLGWDYFTL